MLAGILSDSKGQVGDRLTGAALLVWPGSRLLGQHHTGAVKRFLGVSYPASLILARTPVPNQRVLCARLTSFSVTSGLVDRRVVLSKIMNV